MRKKQNRYRPDTVRRRKVVRRGLKAVLTLVLVFAAVAFISSALAHAYYALLEAPWLRVEEIEIIGLKHVDRKDVLNALRVPRDANLLTLKTSELSQRLKPILWLQSSVVRIDPPGRIVVELKEREPLAMVQAGALLLVDREGNIFSRTEREANPGLLLVTGFEGMDLKEGGDFPEELLDGLKELSDALAVSRDWLPVQSIAECRWLGAAGFALQMAQKPIAVQLGAEDLDQRLHRLKAVLAVLRERQWLDSVTRIDLDYTNRVYVERAVSPPNGA